MKNDPTFVRDFKSQASFQLSNVRGLVTLKYAFGPLWTKPAFACMRMSFWSQAREASKAHVKAYASQLISKRVGL